jgi:serine/threonine protein kinase
MTDHRSLIGQIIDGRFEILRLLGSGGMGEVYLATQLGVGATRAIKVISGDLDADGQMESRFRREAKTLGRLHHENIVQVLEFGRLHQLGTFMVMEYVEGPDTQCWIDENGAQPLHEALQVLTQLADALEYAHQAGVVHRDLKPSNVILHRGDPAHAKIIDFGLVKLVGGEGGTKLTGDQQILGTPFFMSPEQCLSTEVGPAADLYALGALAYFYLSGRPVFNGKTLTSLILAHCYQEPEPLRSRCPGAPAALEKLLLRCLAKRPEDRPTTTEVLDALTAVLREVAYAPLEPTSAGVPFPAILDREPAEARARVIWQEVPAEAAADVNEEHRIREALFNQITALLVELAEALLPLVEPLQERTTRLRQLDEQISGLQLDAALLDSQLDELHSSRPASTSAIARKREELARRATELQGTSNLEYRELYVEVACCRRSVTDPELVVMYDELDGLVEEYTKVASSLERKGA